MIIAGPILRHVDAQSINVWIALNENTALTLALKEGFAAFDDTNATNIAGTSSELTYAVGKKLVVKLLTFKPTVAFQSDKIFSYDIKNTAGSILKDLLSGVTMIPLGYTAKQLPSFTLPAAAVKDLVVAHGSCRKMHGDGPEALYKLDDLVKTSLSDPKKRIQQLFLTGDQLYADEIPHYALWSITDLANRLINDKEDIPIPEATLDDVAFKARRVLPTDALPSLRQHLVRGYAAMTTGEAQSHLLTFGEYCAGYLHTWSPDAWHPDFLNAVKAVEAAPGIEAIETVLQDFAKKISFTIQHAIRNPFYPFLNDRFEEAKKRLQQARKDYEAATTPAQKQFIVDTFVDDNVVTEAVKDYLKEKMDSFVRQMRELANFLKELPKVRRLLANTPTYMIFDDHDVTDDWNLSMDWKNKVYRNPLGKTIVRNGLMAYALFQDLGNNPAAYQDTNSKKTELTNLIASTTTNPKGYAHATDFSMFSSARIDAILGIADSDNKAEITWHYLINSGTKVRTLFLDTRTRRGFKSLNSPPALLDNAAFDAQFTFSPAPQNDEILFVVSACPALGLSLFEELVYPLATTVKGFTEGDNSFTSGKIILDNEAWYLHGEAFETLLKRMSIFKKVVLFSGDIHYGFTTFIDYWKKGETQPTSRFIQLVSSPLKNLWKPNIRLFQSGFAQGVFMGFKGKIEKFGWQASPSVSSSKITVINRRKLRESPAVIDNFGWQEGATVTPDPDWRYRLQVAFDTTNAPKSEDATPFDPKKAADIKAIAQRFHADAKKTRTYRLLYATHVCVVSFDNDNLKHTFHYKSPDNEELSVLHLVPLSATSDADKRQPELARETT